MAPQLRQPPPEAAAARSRLLSDLLASDGDRLLRQARSHSESVHDAEDALADAGLAFLRRYAGPSASADALHWLLKAVRYAAWEISRRRRRRERLHPSVAIERETPYLVATDPDPVEALERAEEVARVSAALDCLASEEREALILLGLGCSYAEIASLRDWSRTKVNRLLSDGRARVRRLLEEEGESS